MAQTQRTSVLTPDADEAAAVGRAALRIERFRFTCAAQGGLRLPRYAGSALRGVLGHALKRAVCVTNQPECPSCLLYRCCVYSYVFETPPPPDAERMRKYPAAPHPFVVAPGSAWRRAVRIGESFDFDVTLVGKAVRHAPYVAHAFRVAGKDGIGAAGGRFQVVRIDQCVDHAVGGWTPIWTGGAFPTPARTRFPSAPPVTEDRVTLAFDTPLRLLRNGRLVGPRDFAFHDLFRPLLRRLSLLTYFHGESPLETDFARLSQASRKVRIATRDLEWFDWSRYSSRQKTHLKMGGVTGHVTVASEELAPFWPYVWIGQWTHAGKGASMGLGRYRVAAGRTAGRSGKGE